MLRPAEAHEIEAYMDTAYARARHPGSELYLGFPADNTRAVRWLDAAGWTRAEESFHDVFPLAGALPARSAAAAPVTEENFPLFCARRGADTETYWNAQRIARTRLIALASEGYNAKAPGEAGGLCGHFVGAGRTYSPHAAAKRSIDHAALAGLVLGSLTACSPGTSL